MVNLKAKPFYLSDDDVQWVEQTIAGMTLEEKIGQLFIMLDREKDPQRTKMLLRDYHLGGCRYQNESAARIYEQNRFYQENAKIPLLIACNCDSGGSGACSDGTYIATAAACGAAQSDEVAYDVGRVSGREGTAVGCNWDFGPVCDLLMNWRNTIVNTRSYGSDPDMVIRRCRAYIQGVHQSGMAACCKHFPGDGIEELDQHLVMGVNTLSCEEWDATFGKVYQALIDDGIKSIMVGHIALPAYSRRLRPGIQDTEIRPGTLAPELLQDLLRGQLGFNGLLVTDASHMAGMTCYAKRSFQVPGAIAAGCDMFLFFNDIEEDFAYMMDGYKSGVITDERLGDALRRILGLKASLGLHRRKQAGTLLPDKKDLACIGCPEHLALAKKAAARSITLVKDTLSVLPVKPATHPRVRAYIISSNPVNRNFKPDPTREIVRQELESFGYQVDLHESYYDREAKGHDPANILLSVKNGKAEEFIAKYDAVFMFLNMTGYAQENNVRLSWSIGHSNEIPWFVREVPTICISLNYTNHLLDVPMMRTFINAYAPTREVIRATLRKIANIEPFEGQCSDAVFCGRWDTRL